jgi:hypothetical protein
VEQAGEQGARRSEEAWWWGGKWSHLCGGVESLGRIPNSGRWTRTYQVERGTVPREKAERQVGSSGGEQVDSYSWVESYRWI